MWELNSKGSFDSLQPRAVGKSISVYCKHSMMFLRCEFSTWPIISWYKFSWCMSGNKSLYFTAYKSITKSVHIKWFICGEGLHLITSHITHLDSVCILFMSEIKSSLPRSISSSNEPEVRVVLPSALWWLIHAHTLNPVLRIHWAFFFFFVLTQQRIAATLLH